MTVIGYARVSSTDQSLVIQEEQLRAAGVEKVFSEQKSGASAENRAALQLLLDYVREGDVVVVTRLDRLARSVVDLRYLISRLEGKGVGFRCLHQSIDTTAPEGRLMLTILGAFAEFELDIRKERQREGIEKARSQGVYKGRKPKVDRAAVEALAGEGLGATEISRRLGVHRRTVYRVAPDLFQA